MLNEWISFRDRKGFNIQWLLWIKRASRFGNQSIWEEEIPHTICNDGFLLFNNWLNAMRMPAENHVGSGTYHLICQCINILSRNEGMLFPPMRNYRHVIILLFILGNLFLYIVIIHGIDTRIGLCCKRTPANRFIPPITKRQKGNAFPIFLKYDWLACFLKISSCTAMHNAHGIQQFNRVDCPFRSQIKEMIVCKADDIDIQLRQAFQIIIFHVDDISFTNHFFLIKGRLVTNRCFQRSHTNICIPENSEDFVTYKQPFSPMQDPSGHNISDRRDYHLYIVFGRFQISFSIRSVYSPKAGPLAD